MDSKTKPKTVWSQKRKILKKGKRLHRCYHETKKSRLWTQTSNRRWYCRKPSPEASLNYCIFANSRWPRRHRTMVDHRQRIEELNCDSTRETLPIFGMQHQHHTSASTGKVPIGRDFSPKRPGLSQQRRKPMFVCSERSYRTWKLSKADFCTIGNNFRHAFPRQSRQAYMFHLEKVLLSCRKPSFHRLNSEKNRHCSHSRLQCTWRQHIPHIACQKPYLTTLTKSMGVHQNDGTYLHNSLLRRRCCQIFMISRITINGVIYR